MAISVVQVNEDSAQLLANETGKVVYLRGPMQWIKIPQVVEWGKPYETEPIEAEMTTDREEAIKWPQFVAIAPVVTEQQHDADMLGANLRVLAEETGMAGALGRQDVRRTIQGIDAITDEINKPLKRKLVQCPVCRVISGSNQLVDGRIWCQSCGMWRDQTPEQAAFRKAVDEFEPDPEPQLRVVRVLEYRGPRTALEAMLRRGNVSDEKPVTYNGVEIVEQIRMRTPLCRWCGEDHLDRESEHWDTIRDVAASGRPVAAAPSHNPETHLLASKGKSVVASVTLDRRQAGDASPTDPSDLPDVWHRTPISR
jgi:hypothetical protein